MRFLTSNKVRFCLVLVLRNLDKRRFVTETSKEGEKGSIVSSWSGAIPGAPISLLFVKQQDV
jgi:hypothetical protein